MACAKQRLEGACILSIMDQMIEVAINQAMMVKERIKARGNADAAFGI